MQNFIFSINATLPIFLLMVLGYFFYRVGIVSRRFAKDLNSFVFRIALPVKLFGDIAGQDFASAWDGKFVLFCFIATLLSIGIAVLLSRLVLPGDRAARGEFIQVAYRSSAAILGVAFIQNIYGEGNTTMAALMMIGSVPLYNIFAVIVLMATAERREGGQQEAGASAGKDAQPVSGPRSGAGQQTAGAGVHAAGEKAGADAPIIRKTVIGIVTNPILLGIFIGLVWSLLKIPVFAIPQKMITDIGRMATPLGLIAMGAMFDPQAARGSVRPAVIASLTKLLLLEALFLPAAVALGFRGQQLVALTVMLGSASTVACYVMATGMGHEGTLTSSTVMITTAGCSFSLTLWLYVLKSLALI